MYIRMKSGRPGDIGRVVDMRNEEALAMLAEGRAIPVNFDDPKALETKIDFDLRDEQTQLVSPSQVTSGPSVEPGVLASDETNASRVRNSRNRRR